MNGLVADGALSPSVVRERKVVKDARPAEHVAASADLGRGGRIKAENKIWASCSSDPTTKAILVQSPSTCKTIKLQYADTHSEFKYKYQLKKSSFGTQIGSFLCLKKR